MKDKELEFQEVTEALLELQRDTKTTIVIMPLVSAWSILSAVQLAASADIFSPKIDKAVECVRRFETDLTSGSKVLASASEAGWTREIPDFPAAFFVREMRRMGDRLINLQLTKFEIWCIICCIQLAIRHHDYKNAKVSKVAMQVALSLQDSLFLPQSLALILQAGWDTRFDR